MPQTRAQARGDVSAKGEKPVTKPKRSETRTKKAEKPAAGQKRQAPSETKEPPKKGRKTDTKEEAPASSANGTSIDSSKVDKLISTYGELPLSDMGLKEPDKPTAETVLAHIFNALLSSGRISHNIAAKSLRCLIKAGYHDLQTLKESTWQKRTEVLTEGGYTHYREKTATALGDLAAFLEEKYESDPTKLLPEGTDPEAVRKELAARLKDIKGLGNVGVEIFMSSSQMLWPPIAPFIDSRSLKTAGEIGIGSDVDAIFTQLKEDPVSMCRLGAALTRVRLEGKTREFK